MAAVADGLYNSAKLVLHLLNAPLTESPVAEFPAVPKSIVNLAILNLSVFIKYV